MISKSKSKCNAIVISVTRLGDFWKFFMTIFLKKKPKCMGLFGLKWKHNFKAKTAVATFGKFWASFYFQRLVALIVIEIVRSVQF